MKQLNDFLKDYTPPVFETIEQAGVIPTDVDIDERQEEFDGKKTVNYYITVNGKEYRMPVSVLVALQEIMNDNPDVKSFKVLKKGEGLQTRYTTIPQ